MDRLMSLTEAPVSRNLISGRLGSVKETAFPPGEYIPPPWRRLYERNERHNMKRAGFSILFAALLAACGQDTTGPGQSLGVVDAPSSARVLLDYPFELSVGRSATIVGQGLTVTFQGVPSDSRCPTGAQCVSTGSAVVQVVLTKDGSAAGAELSTGPEHASVNHLNYNVALVGLEPYPTAAGGTIRESNYRATFWVSRTGP
jgi:hypothetical protein